MQLRDERFAGCRCIVGYVRHGSVHLVNRSGFDGSDVARFHLFNSRLEIVETMLRERDLAPHLFDLLGG